MSHEDARMECKKEGTILAKIGTVEETEFITQMFLSNTGTLKLKEGKLVWIDSKPETANETFKWEDEMEKDDSLLPSSKPEGKGCLVMTT